MRSPHPFLLLTVGLVALILFSSVTAIAATNTLPSTRLDIAVSSIGVNDLMPPACAGLVLTNLVTGAGIVNGTEGNDLILGSSGLDVMSGLGGDDCILGGGGIDQINGGNGNDICVGGSGVDIFTTCEGQIQ